MADQQLAPWEQPQTTAPWEKASAKSVEPNSTPGEPSSIRQIGEDLLTSVFPPAHFLLHPKDVPATLPALGGMAAGAPGAALGSLGSIELRNEFPHIFGEPPQSPLGMATNVGIDTLMQGPLPGKIANALTPEGLRKTVATLIGSKLFKNFPAVKEGASQSITEAGLARYQQPETSIIEDAAAKATNNADISLQSPLTPLQSGPGSEIPSYKSWSKTFKDLNSSAPLSRSELQSLQQPEKTLTSSLSKESTPNEIGDRLIQLQKDFESGKGVASQQSYKKIANLALEDVSHVRNWKLATGEPQTIENLAINDLVTNGFKDSSGKIGAAGILDKLSGAKKEIYEEAISPEKMADFKDFLGQLQEQEKSGVMDKVVNFSKGHLLWTVPGALGALTGHEGFGGFGLGMGAASAGVTLTNSQLGKIMADPNMAKLVIQAMKTPLNSPQATVISQALEMGVRAIGIGTATSANNPPPSQ